MQCVSFIEASLHYQARSICIYQFKKKERKSTTLLKVCKPLSAEIFPRKNRKNLGSPLGFSQKRNVKRVGDESNFGISTRLYMNYEEEDS